MLTPEYLAGLPDEMVALYGEAEQDILADMARRIATYDYWIPAADWQYRKLREAGVCRQEILRILSGLTGRTEAELEALIKQAATEALKSDAKVYADLGYDVTDWRESRALIAILNDGFAATMGELRNLTRTTAVNAAQQFSAALDKAWMKVQTGAFDLNTAVRDAVKEISAAGVSAAKYASGRTDTLEVAVRRAVVTGINQCAGRAQLKLAQELGCEFMEITAHADARPSHAVWQGQIVSLEGREGYLSLDDVGYGRVDGIFGVNCRHGWGPWREGAACAWSEDKLRELNEPKYEYNGQKLTAYEASQTQRNIERNIRRWKREYTAMKAAGQDTTEASVKLRQWQEKQRDFLSQTGLKRQSAREQIYGNVETLKRKPLKSAQANAIITHKKRSEASDVHTIGRLDIEKYKCITGDITTDEVIMTDERVHHVQKRHPGDYEVVAPHLPDAIREPDYILKDADKTGLVLKRVEEGDIRIQVVLRVHTSTDVEGYKNSILSAWCISENRWNNYLRNKIILYKKE